MSKKTEQTSLITLIARASAIALIAVAMPFGLDISIDGDVSFGAPVAYAKRGGVGESGSDRGNNGHGNGGETGQGEEGDTNSDPSNPGRGGKGGGRQHEVLAGVLARSNRHSLDRHAYHEERSAALKST